MGNKLSQVAETLRGLEKTPYGTSVGEKQKVNQVWMNDKVSYQVTTSLRSFRHIWLYGPTGVGKSEIAQNLLSAMGKEFYRIQGHSGFESGDWYGSLQIDENKNLVPVYSDIVRAVEEGIPLIIEEFNLIRASELGPFFSMADSMPFVDIILGKERKRIKKHKDFKVILTANDNGSGDMEHIYNGGEKANGAITSRFNFIEVGYLPEVMEEELIRAKTDLTDRKVIKGMLAVAKQTRAIAEAEEDQLELALSPRNIIAWADAYVVTAKHGGNHPGASHTALAEMTIGNRLPANIKAVLMEMIQNKFEDQAGKKIPLLKDVKYKK